MNFQNTGDIEMSVYLSLTGSSSSNTGTYKSWQHGNVLFVQLQMCLPCSFYLLLAWSPSMMSRTTVVKTSFGAGEEAGTKYASGRFEQSAAVRLRLPQNSPGNCSRCPALAPSHRSGWGDRHAQRARRRRGAPVDRPGPHHVF